MTYLNNKPLVLTPQDLFNSGKVVLCIDEEYIRGYVGIWTVNALKIIEFHFIDKKYL